VARDESSGDGALGTVEVARLEAQRRLALGAAHTLNNALTAALGELAFLRDERKGDPAVVEACDSAARELERCVKAAAALLPQRSGGGPGPTDVVRAARDTASLLRATLGRRGELEVRAPDDMLLVAADAGDLHLAIVLLVQAAVERVGRSARLVLAIDARAGAARLALDARVADAAGLAHEGTVHGDHAAARTRQLALDELAARGGGAVAIAAPEPGRFHAQLELPLVAPVA
jgi:signal transduction histidine kinase